MMEQQVYQSVEHVRDIWLKHMRDNVAISYDKLLRRYILNNQTAFNDVFNTMAITGVKGYKTYFNNELIFLINEEQFGEIFKMYSLDAVCRDLYKSGFIAQSSKGDYQGVFKINSVLGTISGSAILPFYCVRSSIIDGEDVGLLNRWNIHMNLESFHINTFYYYQSLINEDKSYYQPPYVGRNRLFYEEKLEYHNLESEFHKTEQEDIEKELAKINFISNS